MSTPLKVLLLLSILVGLGGGALALHEMQYEGQHSAAVITQQGFSYNEVFGSSGFLLTNDTSQPLQVCVLQPDTSACTPNTQWQDTASGKRLPSVISMPAHQHVDLSFGTTGQFALAVVKNQLPTSWRITAHITGPYEMPVQ